MNPCDEWLLHKNINPRTRRKINEMGIVYKKLKKECIPVANINICEAWLTNKNINPRTGRRITETGAVFRKLRKECVAPALTATPIPADPIPAKPQKISFSNTQIFGETFRTGLTSCSNVVSKMLVDEKINVSGGIDEDKISTITLTEIWSYIYYLWVFNKEIINVFKSMQDERGNAKAELFYSSVWSVIKDDRFYNVRNADKTVIRLNTDGLVYFVNKMVTENYRTIKNPIAIHLRKLIKNNMPQVSTVKVITGRPNVNGSAFLRNSSIKVSSTTT